ncbi:MAG: transporter [Bacteroidales bacterium]
MSNYIKFFSMRAVNFSIALIIVMLSVSISTMAQGDGPRFYWKGMAGLNAIPVIGSNISGNANPSDPSHTVLPGSNVQSTMVMAGYAKVLPLFKRSAMVSVILPMGRISGDMILGGLDYSQSTRGYGDPMLQLSVNIIGPKAIMNLPDMLRYEPGFSVDLMGSVAIPIGEYDNETPLNIGQNRWYGRIGAPVVWQLGSWVPGRRTTLEFLPVMWIFGDNKDFVGYKMETKPMYQVEGHLTRDFMEKVWGSLNVVWYKGGEATIDTIQGTELNNLGIGGTIGYHINDNMELQVAYMSTINDPEQGDLKMDTFRLTLLFGWHKLIEGMQRLKSNE